MGLSIRKERFNRVMSNRKDRVIEALRSLANISNRNNYEFTNDEVTEVYGELLAELKDVFSNFNTGSPRERYQKLLDADRYQYRFLKDQDPEVYKLVEEQLYRSTNNSDRNHHQDNQEDLDKLTDSKLEIFEKKMQRSIDSLIRNKLKMYEEKHEESDLSLRQTLSQMNEKIKGFDKKISRHIAHAELYDHACYVLNPDFDMDSINPHEKFNKERDRLRWIDSVKTVKEIKSPDSPYSNMPGYSNAADCLLHDINRGRVIKVSGW